MTSEQPRRAATTPLAVPQGFQNHPPPAPPLPPQQRARNALNRFLGFPARTSDSDDDGGQGGGYWAEANRATVGRLPSLSAHNASASHKTGLEINSLSINDEGTHALLAGREIFKTIRVEEGCCTEDINLRAAIKTFDAHVAAGGPSKDAVNIHDVAWGKGNYGNFIAAATYNGPIIVYDLNHPGIEVARLYEHRRQVHRVTFNPHAGQHFLSGSQDGTVRLWDLRDLRRDSATFASRFTTTGQNEGVRDVKWSPTDIFALALCTDGGFVQKWDTRKLKTPLTKIAAHRRIAAHTSPCATIDWHPDGKHVLSASADKTVKVWNLSAEGGGRNKPAYEIKTPHPLRNARWRPSCQSSLPKDRGARQCSQMVASYERDYDVLHIWDFRRPWLPFREIQGYRSAPADLLWHSQDLLWTVGKEGMFLQHDVKFADKVLDRRNMQAVAVSPLGEFNFAGQKRLGRLRHGLDSQDSDQFLSHHRIMDEKKTNPQIAGRGSADDSVDDTFLSSSFGKKNTRRGSNILASKPHIEPSPSVSGENQPPQSLRTIALEHALKKNRIFKPGQGTATGPLPGAPNALLLLYFAQKYKTRSLPEPPSAESFLKVQELFEINADFAQQASMYRMAQSWRVAGQAAMTELRRRAIAHRELRVKGTAPRKTAFDESPFAKRTRKYLASERRMSSKPTTPLARPVKRVESLQALHTESTSNVPTPLAKPVSELPHSSRDDYSGGHIPLKEISQEDAGLALPPSVLASEQLHQQNLERGRRVSAQSVVNDRSWYHSADALEERKASLSTWRASSKQQPLSLEPTDSSSTVVRPSAHSHNSDDSFGLFPSLSSRDGSVPVSSVASMSSLMDTVHENLLGSSPHGLMNLGSSSSSEPSMRQNTHAQRYYRYPSSAIPNEEPPPEAVLPSRDSPEEQFLELSARPTSPAQATEIPQARDIAEEVRALAINNQQSFSSDSEALSSAERKPSIDELHEPVSEEVSVDDMEASGTLVPPFPRSQSPLLRFKDGPSPFIRPVALVQHSEIVPSALPSKPSIKPEDVPFTLADFMGTDFQVDSDANLPFTLISMLKQLLNYHTNNVPDAQAATHFILLLTPLLPQTHPLTQSEIDQTITVYSEHFDRLGYTDVEIYSLLQNSFEALIKSGLQPLQAESIISTYHDQLLQLGLFNNAAYLRRLAYPTYPAVYEQGLKDNAMNFMCGRCRKPINNPKNKFRCENCEQRQQPCPICYCTTSPFEPTHKRSNKTKQHKGESSLRNSVALENIDWDYDETNADGAGTTWAEDISKLALYSTCLLCNHSAHKACLHVWHDSSEDRLSPPISAGTCPHPGCLCACTPGPARAAITKALNIQNERTGSLTHSFARQGSTGTLPTTPRIKDDDWVAQESKAVAQASGMFTPLSPEPPLAPPLGPPAAVPHRQTSQPQLQTGLGVQSPGTPLNVRKKSGTSILGAGVRTSSGGSSGGKRKGRNGRNSPFRG
ncbi:hypothetical protein BDV97DRAFT_351305 [Delphinella strobiligena]|nr:hypothetical protein BDV97DRAFT_351305 [Delphinella strobiligena]